MGNATKRLLNVVYRFVQAFNRFEVKKQALHISSQKQKLDTDGRVYEREMKIAVRDED